MLIILGRLHFRDILYQVLSNLVYVVQMNMRMAESRSSELILKRGVKTFVLLFVCLSLAACNIRPKESLQTRTLTPTEAVDIYATNITGSTREQVKSPYTSILALSGGGADGAFGAGILNGWSATGTRPEFNIVTGVSTGALMAALAFLGPKYDGAIRELYTTQTNDKIFRNKGIAGYFSDSLYDNTPLKKQIQSIVTRSFLDKVAAEHAKGRRLYIATTNLDAGTQVIWNMGEIANGNRHNAVLMFQKVLRASAAIPGFFKPVYIKPVKGVQLRQAHVDGGLKEPILVSSFLFNSKARKKQIYLIVNGRLNQFELESAVKPELGDIARKSITELTRSLLATKVYQGYVRASNSRTKFNLVAIPDNVTPSKEALDFNPERMQKLYDVGYKIATSSSPWSSEPPRLQSYDRIARAY